MKLLLSLTLLTTALLCEPALSSAAPIYRCDGKVQFRPCDQPLAVGHVKKKKFVEVNFRQDTPRYTPRRDFMPKPTASRLTLTSNSGFYAEVIDQRMSPLNASTGQWKGTLRGNGNVRLQLHWFRNGLLDSIRSMGSVKLLNKMTSFAFRTSLPRGQGWSWKLAAIASEPS
jgi:hypothetical protein